VGGTTIVGAFTDNGKNGVKAFDPSKEYSFQKLTGKCIIHMHCGIHSLFLVKDDLAGASEQYAEALELTRGLAMFCRKKKVIEFFAGQGIMERIALLQENKWETFSGICPFLVSHFDILEVALAEVRVGNRSAYQPEALTDGQKSAVLAVCAVLGALSSFLVSIEGDFVPLPMFYAYYRKFLDQVKELAESGGAQVVASAMLEAIEARASGGVGS
jgi:hypothetical protein